jgi:hypothetical protein
MMNENGKVLIPKQTLQVFYNIISGLMEKQQNLVNYIFDKILPMVYNRANTANSEILVKEVNAIILKEIVNFSTNDQVILKRSLLAKFALNLPTIVENLSLPKSILLLYFEAFNRVANKLIDDKNNQTTSIPYLGFVLGLSIPCGAQVLDMVSQVKLSSVIQTVFRLKKIAPFVNYFQARAYGPWFRIHTDSNNLTDFNEQGWDDCYLRIAELLQHPFRKHIRGMVGTSWFYDPQLIEISPHLSYLQTRPLERGAFFLRHRSDPISTGFALKKSKTRLRLYKENKYIPKVYSIVWPRKGLIDWAEQTRRKK